jgi:hypothetical protein
MLKRIAPAIVLVLAMALSASAAVTPNSPVTPQTPNRGVVQFLQGTDSAGTYKTLYTAETGGGAVSDCSGLVLNTNDGTAQHLVTLQVVNSTVKYGGTAVTTILSAGFANGVPPMNLLTPTIWPGLPINSDGNPFLRLISGDTLQATFATNLTSSTVINLQITCDDY